MKCIGGELSGTADQFLPAYKSFRVVVVFKPLKSHCEGAQLWGVCTGQYISSLHSPLGRVAATALQAALSRIPTRRAQTARLGRRDTEVYTVQRPTRKPASFSSTESGRLRLRQRADYSYNHLAADLQRARRCVWFLLQIALIRQWPLFSL